MIGGGCGGWGVLESEGCGELPGVDCGDEVAGELEHEVFGRGDGVVLVVWGFAFRGCF